MAVTPTATGGAPKLSYKCSNRRRLNPTKKSIGSTKFLIETLNHSSALCVQQPFTIQASNNPGIEDRDSGIDDADDAGASSTFQITRYILLALVMISTPVVVAVWLLIKQSRIEQQS